MENKIKEPFRKFEAVYPERPIKIEDPIKNKENMDNYKAEVHVIDKMLSGYLKGQNRFSYKFDRDQWEKHGLKVPAYYEILQKYIK